MCVRLGGFDELSLQAWPGDEDEVDGSFLYFSGRKSFQKGHKKKKARSMSHELSESSLKTFNFEKSIKEKIRIDEVPQEHKSEEKACS